MNAELCPKLIELVDKLPSATLMVRRSPEEPTAEIVYVNSAFCRQSGYSPEELVGRSPRLLQGPSADSRTLRSLCNALDRGEDFVGETWTLRQNGTEYRTRWHIHQLHDGDGGVSHLFATLDDVTDRDAPRDGLASLGRATFAGLSIPGFTQLLVMEGKTCRVRVRHKADVGVLDFDQGRLVDAAIGNLTGNDAALRILGWEHAEMSLEPLVEAPLGEIRDSLEFLLLEAARRQDEAARTERTAPPPETHYPWDDGDVLGEWVATQRLHEVFAPVRRAGALGVAFIDTRRGAVLSSVGFLECPNLEKVVASSSQFIRREKRLLEMLGLDDPFEDVIITHSRHWHLMRPIPGTSSLFLFAVFDKSETMLPLARHGLSAAEKALLGPVPEDVGAPLAPEERIAV